MDSLTTKLTCWSRLQDLDATHNQDGDPGRVRRLVRPD